MEIQHSTSSQLIDLSKKPAKTIENTPGELIQKGIEHVREERRNHYSKDLLDDQVESMNDLLKTNQTSVKFNVHEDLDRMYVQVVDLETEEVVKEIPPEQFLDMVASMLKHAGLIVDQRI
ncbi:flagellar protein FlaG [Alkalihalophilus pseudofirmus]|uniref:Flagellar protein FlaG n=1 Tax=Alkalihalophilus pseudofirmus TaxID=79885 RepID=A0AAJ2NPN5_ALKPS|nr:flagellar protein FlaG [Alkalihalophilus pseudofirmus]MDV2886266.1 flagellar protein FlaG [Alkalihalophilus pseudofirmus]